MRSCWPTATSPQSLTRRGSCGPTSFLGGHLSLLHLALLPLYALVPRAESLVVLQAVALGLGAWPLYVLAKDRLRPGAERLAFVLCYLLIAPLSATQAAVQPWVATLGAMGLNDSISSARPVSRGR